MKDLSPKRALLLPDVAPSSGPTSSRHTRYVRPDELEALFGFSRISAWRWEKLPGSRFPAPLRLTSRLVYYDADAIADWLAWRASLGDGREWREQLARPSSKKDCRKRR